MPGLLESVSAPAPATEPLFVVGKPRGLKAPGNLDLLARPSVKNKDGSISTVRSMSFEDEDGNEVLIPQVSADGRIMGQDEAIAHYMQTGEHLGIFSSPQDADRYAQALHEQQAQYYNGNN